MVSTLCSALFLCARRRVADAFASAPLPAALALLLVPCLTGVSLWSGVHAAETLRSTFAADAELARSAAVAVALSAALAGVVVSSVAPGRRALGTQLAAAPVPRAASAIALTVAPVAVLLAATAVPVTLFLAPLAGVATPAALAALAAAVFAGAIAFEAAVAFSRRAVRGFAFAAVGVLVAAADPLTPTARALQGEASLRPYPLAGAALAAWAISVAHRPPSRASRGLVRFSAHGIVLSALARYARRPQLRAYAIAAVAFGAGGVAALRMAGLPVAAAALVASLTVILGAAVFALAAPGLDGCADWVWRLAPVRTWWLFLRFAFAAVAAAAAVGAVGVAAAWAVAPAEPRLVASVAAAAAVVFGSALLSGSVVAWREGGGGDQLACLGAFAAVATGWSFAAGRVAIVLGLEAGAGAAAVAVGALVAAVGFAVALRARSVR